MVADQAPPALHCEVDANVNGDHVTLRGLITAVRGGAGSYTLMVKKSGASGTSTIKQAGGFNTQADQSVSVGSVVLDYQNGTRYTAELDVSFEGAVFKCDLAPRSLK
ncbi:curli-like amyloid fiber formation chaperone CsgH [Rhodopseudomonas pseudopalustris]|uniref:CsgH-like domain-containing protein n=2 Tax=Rhodopseudomonas TaxID=1073 RepID=Q136N1_RHOPS|nr:curli-like amyloid fiber formation chaperone CsgH [Rhodopseudomonas pseudopalustris]ABE39958.1 conserved hypothetical protein [Rhodopseudomonas palustris BisB5]SEO84915.1 hypothetical protein SAMN05444123_105182 [Rhodopseudomonas pseudopalustris]